MDSELVDDLARLPESDDKAEVRARRIRTSRTIILPGQVSDEELASEASRSETELRFAESEPELGVEVMLELEGIKSATLISDTRPLPVESEGLLLAHERLALCSEHCVALTADDHEVVRERFILPTDRRSEVVEAHRKLAELSEDFLLEPAKRDTAMSVYYPELSEEVDIWYRIEIDEHRLLTYRIHAGPSHRQEIKKKIEGELQL